MVVNKDFEDFIKRMESAALNLELLASGETDDQRLRHLHSKAEGVRLALSYAREVPLHN